jgi:hypothetical protein
MALEPDKQIEILKKKTPAERLSLAFGLFDFARQRITAEILRLNPDLKPPELTKLVNQRMNALAHEPLKPPSD